MSDYYLDLKVISAVPQAYLKDSKELLAIAGQNIGNYAFRHALSMMFDLDGFFVTSFAGLDLLGEDEKPSKIVVSCANWLGDSEQYEQSNGDRASILEKTDCRVVAFGLGAQAGSNDAELSLGPQTIRLAKVLSERNRYLSVRDEYTYAILEKIGIKNAVITGCPSNFINLDPNLGQAIATRAAACSQKKQSWGDLRTHISEISGGHSFSNQVLRQLFAVLHHSPSFYILQSPVLFPLLLGGQEVVPEPYLSSQLAEFETIDQYVCFLKSKLLHFSSIDGWLDFARTCDLSLGMRIHGSIIPLQAGVPAMIIAHDSRTEGLSDFMDIPAISPESLGAYLEAEPARVFDQIGLKMGGYDSRRCEIAKIFVSYLEDCELLVKEDFQAFAA